MYKEIYRLLKEYEGQELTDDFIEIAFNIISQYYDLYFYAKDVEISDTDRSLGEYDKERRIVIVNKENILRAGPRNGLKMNIDKKLLTLEVLRHEIEHAVHLKKLYELKNDVESRIIRSSLRNYALNHGLAKPKSFVEMDPYYLMERKQDGYGIDPAERLAEIRGWKFIINLIKNSRTSEDLIYARNMLYYAYAKGYIKSGYFRVPTYDFLINMGLVDEYKELNELVNDSRYSFSTRVTLGLPITHEEYTQSIRKKAKI